VVLKRGAWPLYMFILYQKKGPYILHMLYTLYRNFIR